MASTTTSSAPGTSWKPGGIQAKPSTKPAANAKIKKATFYRQMPGRNPTPVVGIRYAFASNFAHPNNKAVVVEDLSQIDIDSAIKSKFEAILPVLLHDPVGVLGDTFTNFEENLELGYMVEVFDFFGLKLSVEPTRNWTYDQVEPTSIPNVLSPSKSKKIANSTSMVKNLLRLLFSRESEKRKKLTAMAHGRLYRAKDLVVEVARCQKIVDGSVPMPTQVRKHWITVRGKHRDIPNKHHQLQIDRACAAVCDVISSKDVVILRDKDHSLIAGALLGAAQKFYPKGTLEKLDRALRSWAWLYSISEADRIRHGTHYDDHLVQHPEKDIELSYDPHHVANGTDHFGVKYATGHSNLGELQCQVFAQGRNPIVALKKSLAFKTELPKLKEGLWGLTEKEVRLTLKAWDPELYDELVRMWRILPPSIRVTFATTGDNPHQFIAQLIDVQTEGHVDSTDMKGGLAAIKCFGDFTGGDLVFKELGVRIEYPSGSHCHLRGRELQHFIAKYEGTRHCIVLTVKEAVVQAVKELEERIEELRGTAEVFRARGLESLTDEELELVKASESDDESSEYIYGFEKAMVVLANAAKRDEKVAKKADKAAKDADEEAEEAEEEAKQEANRSGEPRGSTLKKEKKVKTKRKSNPRSPGSE